MKQIFLGKEGSYKNLNLSQFSYIVTVACSLIKVACSTGLVTSIYRPLTSLYCLFHVYLPSLYVPFQLPNGRMYQCRRVSAYTSRLLEYISLYVILPSLYVSLTSLYRLFTVPLRLFTVPLQLSKCRMCLNESGSFYRQIVWMRVAFIHTNCYFSLALSVAYIMA